MQTITIKTHNDGIWVSANRERDIVSQCNQHILAQGFWPLFESTNNYGIPYRYQRKNLQLHCRFVDSVVMEQPDVWTSGHTVITDNIPLTAVQGTLLSVVPEFWSIWQFDPVYLNRRPSYAYNCFMHRARGDRSLVFYQLIKRDLLRQGQVSYNCSLAEYEQQYLNLACTQYAIEHDRGRSLIPFNTVQQHGTLEQCIIDSEVSLVMETYTSDNHIVFSEKIFRVLQLPRPWLLYCSPGAVACLKQHGFDVLDDVIDHGYDQILLHRVRMNKILDQLQTQVQQGLGWCDVERCQQAAEHNQQLLKQWQQDWPERFQRLINQIAEL
jgi:hypothetical protein